MRYVITVLIVPVVVAMFMAARVYEEASAATAQGRLIPVGSNTCGTRTTPMRIVGPKFNPKEVVGSGEVICTRRVLWIKITACLVRYGSVRDTSPKVGECRSAASTIDDRLATTVRAHCHYTTVDYLWILEMHVQVRGMSGKRGATTDFSWPIETRCF